MQLVVSCVSYDLLAAYDLPIIRCLERFPEMVEAAIPLRAPGQLTANLAIITCGLDRWHELRESCSLTLQLPHYSLAEPLPVARSHYVTSKFVCLFERFAATVGAISRMPQRPRFLIHNTSLL